MNPHSVLWSLPFLRTLNPLSLLEPSFSLFLLNWQHRLIIIFVLLFVSCNRSEVVVNLVYSCKTFHHPKLYAGENGRREDQNVVKRRHGWLLFLFPLSVLTTVLNVLKYKHKECPQRKTILRVKMNIVNSWKNTRKTDLSLTCAALSLTCAHLSLACAHLSLAYVYGPRVGWLTWEQYTKLVLSVLVLRICCSEYTSWILEIIFNHFINMWDHSLSLKILMLRVKQLCRGIARLKIVSNLSLNSKDV